ncbi:MAG: MBL fold metallo-hydrolase [Gemmatimonadaceae bacterium]
MTLFICNACGTQFAEQSGANDMRDTSPGSCPTCMDERQYVPRGGQRWTTLEALRSDHRNYFHQVAPGLYGVGTTPAFAIDERALLVAQMATPGAREPMVMWDCISLLDDATIDIIRALGGLTAIAISHPHFYTTMVEWARAFDCPVFLHADDRAWVVRPDRAITFWEGETRSLADVGAAGMTLIRCGGHFAGGTVLHWADGAEGRGALLTGDILQVSSDLASVSIMRSYPNNIPVSAAVVRRASEAIAPFAFDALYGAFLNRQIEHDAKGAVERSLARLVERLEGVTGPDAPLPRR